MNWHGVTKITIKMIKVIILWSRKQFQGKWKNTFHVILAKVTSTVLFSFKSIEKMSKRFLGLSKNISKIAAVLDV